MDIINKKFSRLTVLEKVRTDKNGHSYYLCECNCGNTKTINRCSLINGTTKSCGCLKKEQDKKNLCNIKHNLSSHRVYWVRIGMIDRCYNKKSKSFKNYGGRGIEVYNEWLDSVEVFYEWAISSGYETGKTIDRIDNNGNYEPSNCRWVDIKAQCNNRRNNILINHNGKNLTLMELAEATKLAYQTLRMRYVRGDRGDLLIRPTGTIIKPLRGEINHTSKIDQETAKLIKSKLKDNVNIRQLARDLNISHNIVYDIKRGKTWTWI
jgi:hypothetical protein